MKPDRAGAASSMRAVTNRPGFSSFLSLGTTASTSIDPAEALARICRREKLWLHLDGAYGAAAALAPEFRPLFEGWEQAD